MEPVEARKEAVAPVAEAAVYRPQQGRGVAVRLRSTPSPQNLGQPTRIGRAASLVATIGTHFHQPVKSGIDRNS